MAIASMFEKSTTQVPRATGSQREPGSHFCLSECIHMRIASITVIAGLTPDGRSGTVKKVA